MENETLNRVLGCVAWAWICYKRDTTSSTHKRPDSLEGEPEHFSLHQLHWGRTTTNFNSHPHFLFHFSDTMLEAA